MSRKSYKQRIAKEERKKAVVESLYLKMDEEITSVLRRNKKEGELLVSRKSGFATLRARAQLANECHDSSHAP